ncbi:MAG: 2Fe-2S iron-sulfur cluster binding domain-containing protein [Hyphomicrobiales bacterium]|nr:MAG: 2Fe-2S iron-sulfur cluster binding domain-containing protein [Hyphomicrobiales bacterium]
MKAPPRQTLSGGIEAIEAVCSGNAYCGTCRISVEPEWREIMGGATEIELPMIEAAGDATPGVRLSCQITVTPEMAGLVVRMHERQS